MRGGRDISGAMLAAMLAIAGWSSVAAAVTYDIVYVRQPRFGNNTNTTWPEVAHPAKIVIRQCLAGQPHVRPIKTILGTRAFAGDSQRHYRPTNC